MLGRLGFVASVLSENLTTSRTCRLSNATPLRLRELTAENLATLDQVLTFLDRHEIGLYRISSNIIPFASHPINTVRWWKDFASDLRHLGARIRRLGVRASMHPGQYTVLNSPSPAIVASAVAELVYQARLLDALDTDRSSKIVIHVGGLYGGTEADAIGRFIERARKLPKNVLERLVIENDDRLFDADEVLIVHRELGIPVVFDWLHHQANPCARPVADVLRDVFATWTAADGRPKIHMSSQAKGGPPGAHADDVAASDVLAFLRVAPEARFDCMLEAKEKDRALLRLRKALRRRGVVETRA
jgi:UV DNA damage endonuclease